MTDILQRNNVQVIGKGEQVILFAHGFGCDQNAWKYLTPAFTNNYKLLLFDYVGAGNSVTALYDKERYSTLGGYATDIIEICDALKLKNIIFIGHSVSCMIGMLASIRQPELFSKMIFIGPSPCYINDEQYTGGFERKTIDSLLEVMEEDYISWARSLAPQIMGEENDPALGTELADSFCYIDPHIAKQFARVTFLSDNRKDLSKLTVPSLTIQCVQDIIAPLAVGQFINQRTLNNTLVILDAHGHCPHMSHPRQTAAAIQQYL